MAELTDRQRRLVDTALVLGVIVLAFLVIDFVARVFFGFFDVLLLFFLAWLLAFALGPLIRGVQHLAPRLPPPAAVAVVYAAVAFLIVVSLIQLSASLASSIGQLLADLPRLQVELERLTRGLQERLQVLGFNVDLVSQVPQVVDNLQDYADDLIGPLQSLAVASMGVFGNILILFMLSLYFAIDRPSIAQFMNRLVPPAYATEAQLLETSVTRSFGGFLRGQLVMGVAYGAVASLAVVLFGLPYGAAAAVTSGFLHAIPFFGPFISWAPPVLIALLTGGPVVPVLIVMAVGWLLTMNVLQPRLMADAVGIHPIIVLASVVIGTKIAGIPGAIFGIPIAAVLSAFFFHWYGRSRDSGTVADRAARRVEEREGRPVRRPREPVAGVDEDVVEPGVAGTSPGRAGLAEGDRA